MTDVQRFTVGQCEVIKIPEIDVPFPAATLWPHSPLPADTPEQITLSVHSWVVRTPQHTLVIDTANGNGRERPHAPMFHQLNTDWLRHLQDAGVDPHRVDWVLMTHLHGDHIGWNTHWVNGQWQPLFPRARYVCPEKGLARWQRDPTRQAMMADSLTPLIDAGLLETMHPEQQPVFADLLRVVPTPGHTPDHTAIILHSAGEYALFTGDLMHNALQVSQPQLASCFCEDAEQAEAQRRWALNWAADHQALWCSAHFAGSSAGRVTRAGDGFTWQYC
ncbi:MBL fold metallo-hydrolase [Pantoea sp. 1.19]|uniref:MBL fold metallo-hydrolase n=1 Tax=Pantoea sp. 1.19 TaxID=1925589 RepID=UPI0009491858|nr:MBL fold metallo-hydrolase [Pantoea sp. 1.19]